jgi:hypothetical protein
MAASPKSFVIFFGDSSQDTFDYSLIKNLTKNDKPLLGRFMLDVQNALQEECARLHSTELLHLFSNGSLNFLLERGREEKILHPALCAVKLVLIQLASFIL